jgi:hypothetical protein
MRIVVVITIWFCSVLPFSVQASDTKRGAPKGTLSYASIHDLSDEELRKLQYFSNGFELVRVVSNTSEHHVSGKLMTQNNQTYEIIRFKKGTPGIATNVKRSRFPATATISVSFEPNCSINYRASEREAGPHSGFVLAVENKDEIEYCGFRYKVSVNPSTPLYSVMLYCCWVSSYAPYDFIGQPRPGFFLIADIKHDGTTTKDKRDVPGRRVEVK